jgi:IS30 family transposase
MHTAECCRWDLAQQFNVHPSTISRPLSRFGVKRQVSDRRRYRHQLKQWFIETSVLLQRRGVTTSCLHPKLQVSYVRQLE